MDASIRTAPTDTHFLEMTILDVFKQISMKIDTNTAWDFIIEEYEALDRRKGLMSKAAISAVEQQASALAKSSFQKGVASFLLSREGVNYAQRYSAAKIAVSKLATQVTSGDIQTQGQTIYLALSYLELYVAQQELLKKKTEEEMESLGPLIQSSVNVEVPLGEDASTVTSDGTSVDTVSFSYLKLELELKNEWLKALYSGRSLCNLAGIPWSTGTLSSTLLNL